MFLNRRARNVTIGAEDAAIPPLRFQQYAAMRAIVKELAGIGRHGFQRLLATCGTGQERGGPNHLTDRLLSRTGSRRGHASAASTMSAVAKDSIWIVPMRRLAAPLSAPAQQTLAFRRLSAQALTSAATATAINGTRHGASLDKALKTPAPAPKEAKASGMRQQDDAISAPTLAAIPPATHRTPPLSMPMRLRDVR